MWSDQASPEQLRKWVAQLHSVLPAPASGASMKITPLHDPATREQIAEEFSGEPGFACVNFTTKSGGVGTYLLRRPLASVSYSNGCAAITGPNGSVELRGLGFDILQAVLQAWRGWEGALLAGSLAYDLAGEIEDLGVAPPADFTFPGLHFGLYDSALVFENAAIPPAPPRHAASALLTSRPDRAAFEASVERIVRTIYAGDIFQTNLCRRLTAPLQPAAAWPLHQRMRAISPSRYEAFLRIDDQRAILSVSPELFLKVAEGVVESAPIKGTRPRSDSAEEDRVLASQLLASEKDRAELAMIVDVVRNDLARVCETGSINVVTHAELMTLPTVHHLFSRVRGKLRADAGPVELLRAAFPAASISGAPKIEAMRIAMREEGQLRGPCMGAIGWIALDGRMELSVAIRTAFVTGGWVRYYAGCGITAGSDPETEFAESSHKAAAFIRALK